MVIHTDPIMDLFYVYPLITAFIYTLGALCLKRSSEAGVGPWRTTFFSNVIHGVLALGFFWTSDVALSFGDVIDVSKAAVCFFLGQLFTCLAIHKGDISLVTPLMGIKVILVGVFRIIFIGEVATANIWIGACLSILAVFLLGGKQAARRDRIIPSICYGSASALFFAMADVLVEVNGATIPFGPMVALMFGSIAVYSVVLILLFKGSMLDISGTSWKWMTGGSTLLGGQAIAMAYIFSTFGDATVVNIIYSSRGVWSVVLVWCIGHWFANQESSMGKALLLRRLIGAVLMTCAILFALSG